MRRRRAIASANRSVNAAVAPSERHEEGAQQSEVGESVDLNANRANTTPTNAAELAPTVAATWRANRLENRSHRACRASRRSAPHAERLDLAVTVRLDYLRPGHSVESGQGLVAF